MNSSVYLGNVKILNLKFGGKDVKLYLGNTIVYPTTIPITNAVVTCSDAIYNGKNQVATNIVVTLSGVTLVEGVDYVVTSNTGGTNASSYTVSVSGINSYDETASCTFNIEKVTPTVIAPTPITILVYNATAQQLIEEAVVDWGTIQYSIDGGSWTTTVPSATNAKEYTIRYRVVGDSNINDVAAKSITSTINKVTPTVTAPSPKSGLVYSGSQQQLATAGSTNWGTMKYSLDGSTYSTSVPSGTNATTYAVYYRVDGDSNINSVPASSINCSIAKADPTYTAPSAKSLTYNGNSQALLNAGSTSHGTIQYSPNNSSWSTTIPSQTNANTYTSYWRLIGDSNHNDKASTSISTTIAKAAGSVSTKPTARSLTYNATAQDLVNAGSGTGTIMYKLGSGSYSSTLPSATNATSYTVYYYAAESANYKQSAEGSVVCTIAKVTPTVTAPTPKVLTFNNANQVLANAGSTNYGTIQYCLNSSGGTYSTTVPSASAANVTYKVWYKVVGNSNVNDVAPKSIDCSIAEKRVTTPTITLSPSNYTYNGSQCKPTPTVKDGSTVIPSSEYTATYSNNTNAGTATVTISDNTAGNYYISGTTTFTINKASGSVTTAPVNTNYTYNGTARAVASAGSGTGTMYYRLGASGSFSTTMPTMTNAGSNTLYYYAAASTNYEQSSTGSITVSVQKANISPTVSISNWTYGGTASNPSVAGNSGSGTVTYYYKSTSSSSWSTTKPSAAGSYDIRADIAATTNYNSGTCTNSFTINKATPSYTAPSAKSLTYTGSGQALLNAGSTSHGTIQYSSNNSSWSTTIPSQTNAGTYTSYWRLIGDANHNDISSTSINTTIAKAACCSTAPTAKSLTYTGSGQALLNAGSSSCGTMQYSSTATGTYTTTIPSQTNAGAYTSYWKVANDSNHSGTCSGSVSTTIAKANQSAPTATGATVSYGSTATATASGGGGVGTLTWTNGSTRAATGTTTTAAYWSGNDNYNASPNSNSVNLVVNKAAGSVTIAGVSLTYNATSRNLATVSNNTGTMHYSTNGTSWSTTIPTATNVGSWTIYWYMDASTNYNGISSASTRYVSSSIGKANQSAPTATGATTTYSTVATAKASGGGGVGSIEWSNGSSRSTAGSQNTQARWTGDGNYNPSPWSNQVTLTVNKANCGISVVGNSLTYNSSSQYLVSVSNNCENGTMHYKVGNGSWSTSIPTSTNAGSWTIYWYRDATTNYNGNYSSSSPGSVSASIGKANQSAPTATGATTTYPTTATATASGGGGQGSIEWSNGSSRSTAGEQTTKARWSGNGNYNASPYSSAVTIKVNKATPTTTFVVDTTTYPTTAYVTFYSSVAGTIYETYNGTQLTSSNYSTAAQITKSVTAGNGTSTNPCVVDSGGRANSWTIYCYFVPTDSTNYNAVQLGPKTLTVNKASQSAPTATGGVAGYGGTATATASGGGGQGSIEWSNGNTLTGNAGSSKTTKARWSGNSNYNASPYSNEVTLSIVKANQSAPTAAGATTTYPTKATATASGGGGQGSIEWSNGSSRSTAGSQNTKARWGGNSNYNASSWSNEVTLTVNKATPTTTFVVDTTTYPTTAYVTFYSSVAGTIYETWNGTQLTSSNYSTAAQRSKSVTAGNGTSTNPCVVDSGGSPNSWTIYCYFVPTDSTNYNAVQLGPKTLTVNKGSGSVSTAPANSGSTYGSGNYLCSTGSGTGTMYYRLGTSGSFSTTRPTTNGLNAGSYTLYYYAAESTNYTQSSTGSITVTVAKAAGSVTTAPTAKSLTYNGSAQEVITAGSGTGTMMYKLMSNAWQTSIPTLTDSTYSTGSLTVYYKASASTNYNESATGSVTVTMDRASTCASITNWSAATMAIGDYYTFNLSDGCEATRWETLNSSVAVIVSTFQRSAEILCTGTGTTRIYAYYDGDNNHYSSSDWGQVTVTAATRGYHNGYEWVDLGLPSGTKWATSSIGFYQFGAQYYAAITSGSCYYCSGTYSPGDSSHDAARYNMGGSWQMPTSSDVQELLDNCDYRYGSNYCTFTSKINGEKLYIDTSGCFTPSMSKVQTSGAYLWTSTGNGSNKAYFLSCGNSGSGVYGDGNRDYGRPVYGVYKG